MTRSIHLSNLLLIRNLLSSLDSPLKGTILFKSQNLMDLLQANIVDFRVYVN